MNTGGIKMKNNVYCIIAFSLVSVLTFCSVFSLPSFAETGEEDSSPLFPYTEPGTVSGDYEYYVCTGDDAENPDTLELIRYHGSDTDLGLPVEIDGKK